MGETAARENSDLRRMGTQRAIEGEAERKVWQVGGFIVPWNLCCWQ